MSSNRSFVREYHLDKDCPILLEYHCDHRSQYAGLTCPSRTTMPHARRSAYCTKVLARIKKPTSGARNRHQGQLHFGEREAITLYPRTKRPSQNTFACSYGKAIVLSELLKSISFGYRPTSWRRTDLLWEDADGESILTFSTTKNSSWSASEDWPMRPKCSQLRMAWSIIHFAFRSDRRYHCTMDFQEVRCILARRLAEDLVVKALSSTLRSGGVTFLARRLWRLLRGESTCIG